MQEANKWFQEAKSVEEQTQKAQNEALKATLANDSLAAASATSRVTSVAYKLKPSP